MLLLYFHVFYIFDKNVHALGGCCPTCAKANNFFSAFCVAPKFRQTVFGKEFNLCISQYRELLVGGTFDEEGDPLIHEGLLQLHGIFVGLPGDIEIQAVLEQSMELEA